MKKYWSLLTNDPILSNYVTDKPSVTYRRNTSRRENLVQSHYTDRTLERSVTKGTFHCGACDACSSLDTRTKVLLANGQQWHPVRNVTCDTMGVVYLLQCPCQAYYVGKTSQPLKVRILEHAESARSGYVRTTIGRHVAFMHDYIFTGFKFLPLAVIPPPPR